MYAISVITPTSTITARMSEGIRTGCPWRRRIPITIKVISMITNNTRSMCSLFEVRGEVRHLLVKGKIPGRKATVKNVKMRVATLPPFS